MSTTSLKNLPILFLATLVLLLCCIPAVNGNFIAYTNMDAVCREVNFPLLCQKVVQAARPTTVADLTIASITETINVANAAKKKVEELAVTHKNDKKTARILNTCAREYASAAESLQEAIGGLKSGDKTAARQALYSGGVDSITSCHDSFVPPGDDEKDFPGKEAYTELYNMAVNSYTLSCGSMTECS